MRKRRSSFIAPQIIFIKVQSSAVSLFDEVERYNVKQINYYLEMQFWVCLHSKTGFMS